MKIEASKKCQTIKLRIGCCSTNNMPTCMMEDEMKDFLCFMLVITGIKNCDANDYALYMYVVHSTLKYKQLTMHT